MPIRQRSRACESCRARKIKCDGRLPGCTRCESIGVVCSGPIVGPIIVPFDPRKRAQKPKVSPRRKDAAKDDSAPSNRQTVLRWGSPSYSNVDSVSELPVTRDVFALKLQEVLCIPHQSEQSIVSQLLNWSSSADMPTLQRAIWAVSAGISATVTRNPDFSHKAKQSYMLALNGLRAELIRNEMAKKEILQEDGVVRVVRRPISLEMIAVATVFIWYEGCIATTAIAFIDHCKGAGRLLLTRSPEDFTSSLSFPIFRTVRYVMAIHGLMMMEPSGFTAHSWMTVPYSGTPKIAMDRLTDFMILIPIPLSWVDRHCSNGLPVHRSTEAENILKDIKMLELGLKKWWLDYQDEVIAKDGWAFKDVAPDSVDANGAYIPMTRHYSSDAVAECVAHYEMCRLALSVAKAAFYGGIDFHACRSEAVAQTASLLSVVPWYDEHSTTHKAREFFGMLGCFILAVVATPSKLLGDYATFILYSWGPPDGLDGSASEGPVFVWRRLKGVWQREDSVEFATVLEIPVPQII